MTPSDILDALRDDRVLTVVRAPEIPDARDLCAALVDGGIRVVELTFTTPDLPRHLQRAAETAASTGALIGAGTVLDEAAARTAVSAGARFLVTPGLGPDAGAIVEIAHRAGAPVILGALTPSEVMTAVAIGADAVKVFPAHQFGPTYFRDLRGPFPDVRLVPSGGVTSANARSFLEAGALAVSAGSNVVSADDVSAGRWSSVSAKASAFCESLR
jgi:2-dehydro-3-deoxyphosphogluconate aldolase / (4S)-4-hydroxy-2-oxoglutarate aldolase